MASDTRFIAVMNQKGGVGKTTVTVNLGAALARLGKEVLLLDLDPQANLSIHLDVPIHELSGSIYDVLVGESPLADVVLHHVQPGLSLAPANIDLSGAEVELVNAVGRETLLRDALKPYLEQRPCDFVLFDCPPSLGILSLNALSAAKEVFIPIQTEFFALQGLAKLLGVIELIARRLNPDLRLSLVVPTLFDTRTSLSREVLSDIGEHFGELVTRVCIRKNVRLAEAPSHGKTIFEYELSSSGSEDFMQLAREVLGLEEEKPAPRAPRRKPRKKLAAATATADGAAAAQEDANATGRTDAGHDEKPAERPQEGEGQIAELEAIAARAIEEAEALGLTRDAGDPAEGAREAAGGGNDAADSAAEGAGAAPAAILRRRNGAHACGRWPCRRPRRMFLRRAGTRS